MDLGIFDHLDRGAAEPDAMGALFETRLRLAEAYDRAGFYAYHQAEHHGTPLGAAPSPGLFLAAMAQRTRRLRFGPLVYTLPLYHPLRLIEEICMLDQMSGGRLELGVGRGISPHELRFYGVEPAEAQVRYIEMLELILQGLASAGGELSFHGKFYSVDAVPMVMGPVQRPHPPLWYGLANAGGVPWAAQHGVNVVGNLTAAMMRPITDRYRAEWATLGHSPAELPRMGFSRHIVVAETDAEALRLGRRAFRNWLASFMYLWELRGGKPPNAVFPDSFDELVAQGKAAAGAPATVLDTLAGQAAEGGINYLLCRFAFGDLTQAESLHSLALFTGQVMPELQGLRQAAE